MSTQSVRKKMAYTKTLLKMDEPEQLVQLHESLFKAAASHPQSIALISENEKWTYERFARYVASLAHGIVAQGVQQGERVALHLTNKVETVAAFYACMVTGVIASPLNTRYKQAELESILRRLRPALYLGQADLYGEVAKIDPSILGIDKRFLVDSPRDVKGTRPWSDLIGGNECEQPLLASPHPDEPMLLLPTSGTTGEPKLVAHTPRTTVAMVRAFQPIAFTSQEVLLIATPMMHAAGIFNALTALLTGATCVLMDRFDPDGALDLIERHRCTMLVGLPFMFAGLLAKQLARPRKITSIGTCLAGGDTTPGVLQEEFLKAFGVRIRNILAMSESIGTFTYGFDFTPVSRAVFPERVRLVDEQGNVVPRGEPGELQLRGPNVFAGYWKGPGHIDAARKDGWWPTGDVLQQDETGDYWYAARRKNLIIRGGSNISPVEVEHALTINRGIRNAAVIGIPDDVLGQRVIGFVELADPTVQVEDVLADVSTRLANYKTPERLIVIDQIPRNSLGKIDRMRLQSLAAIQDSEPA
jgi:long-chain acyl-CoA synthetase